jgi:pSer/pThr/pTyr-binding forkhead associated (FHA) protein
MYSRCVLDIHSPEGKLVTQQIESEYLTIGRSDDNGLVLEDAEKNISRYHCVLEYQTNYWWVSDTKPSANGTFLQRYRNPAVRLDVRQHEKLRLEDKDEILIPAKLLDKGSPIYWKLIFRDSDSGKTNRIPYFQPTELQYSRSRKKLWRLTGGVLEEIKLRPQALCLIDYMAHKETSDTNIPKVFNASDLIKNIFDDDISRNNDLAHLIWEIRRKIELDSGEPEFLKTEDRQKYSLKITLIP